VVRLLGSGYVGLGHPLERPASPVKEFPLPVGVLAERVTLAISFLETRFLRSGPRGAVAFRRYRTLLGGE
jgi:hypothetical protein